MNWYYEFAYNMKMSYMYLLIEIIKTFNIYNKFQGFLDEQFIELEELQDDANPNFVEEVVTLFFKDSTRLILNIDQALYVILINFQSFIFSKFLYPT